MYQLVLLFTINLNEILSAVIWIIVGIVLTEIYEYVKGSLKTNREIKFLKSIEGVYIVSAKEDPNDYSAIIKINRKKDSTCVIEFTGTSLKASDYTGTVQINENNPSTGIGNYIHRTQNLKRGEYTGYGTIDIIIKSENLILVHQTYQYGSKDYRNPEIWKRIEGEDIGMSIQSLKRKYMQKRKEYIDSKSVI